MASDDKRTDDLEALLSPAEAAAVFNLNERNLTRQLRHGDIPGAHKTRGLRGFEWRIPVSALEAAGYERRIVLDEKGDDVSEQIAELTEALQAERRRSSALEGKLGYVQMELARARRELRELRGEDR